MAKVPPRNPKYTPADLWPPGSQGNVDFPPAAFHPVYLGNFLCQQQDEMVARVQQYFASKGLLARMVFVRNAQNDPFRNYQDRTKLYDCLVYFTRPEDALDAVKYLHRDKYYGHRLNIFPGRVPEPVLAENSVEYDLPDTMEYWPDIMITAHIKRETQAQDQCTKRHSAKQLIVQYVDRTHQEFAVCRYRYLVPQSLANESLIYHQRFLEQDVIGEIRHQIEHTMFMAMGPELHVLNALYSGFKPKVPLDWHQNVVPKLDVFLVNHSIVPPSGRAQLKVARATLVTFGQQCKFVGKLVNSSDQQVVNEVRKYYKTLPQNLEKYRKRYNKSVKNSSLKVQLPWRKAMEN